MRLQSISELVLLFTLPRNFRFPELLCCVFSDANLRVPCFFRCLIFKVLGTFFPSASHFRLTRPSSARLYYHSQLRLSTPFSNFFGLFPNFFYTYPGVSSCTYKISAGRAQRLLPALYNVYYSLSFPNIIAPVIAVAASESTAVNILYPLLTVRPSFRAPRADAASRPRVSVRGRHNSYADCRISEPRPRGCRSARCSASSPHQAAGTRRRTRHL